MRLPCALRDDIREGQRVWLSRCADIRAVKEALAIAGDEQAIIVNLDSFAIGLLAGTAFAAGLWVILFNFTEDHGQPLLQKAMPSEAETLAPSLPLPDNQR
jgi:hypothetical protein